LAKEKEFEINLHFSA